MIEPWPLPRTWEWRLMGDIADVVGGGTPNTDRAEYYGGEVPWITPKDLSGYGEKTISRGARNITKAGLENSGAQMLPVGSVLFSSRAPIGYVAIAKGSLCTNQGFKSFVLRDRVSPDFIYYYLQLAKKMAEQLASGTTFLEISAKQAARIPVPITAPEEQDAIVQEIEKQFVRLDAGITALQRVEIAMKRYRAAVIKAACEGQLVPTEAELARNSGRSFETAEDLLTRIAEERRKKWDGRRKYREPAAVAAMDPPALPDGWTWATLESLTKAIQDVDHRMPKRVAEGIPYVSTRDFVDSSGIDFVNAKRISRTDFDNLCRKVRPEPGDILLSRYGTIGLVRRVMESFEFQASYSIAILKTLPIEALNPYLVIVLQSECVQAQIRRSIRSIAQPDLGLDSIRKLAIPVPPSAEQSRVVAEVERRLSIIDELNAVIESNLSRAKNLRQAILQKAFSGGLLRCSDPSGAKRRAVEAYK